MTFREDLKHISGDSPSCAAWIHFFNFLVIAFAIVGAPFTLFASLFALLAVPFNSALASIATSTYRQRKLTKLHLILLADKYDLD